MQRFTSLETAVQDATSDGNVELSLLDGNVEIRPPDVAIMTWEFFDASDNPVRSGVTGTVDIIASTTLNSPTFQLPPAPVDLSASLEPINTEGTVMSWMKFSWSNIAGADKIKFIVFQR